MSVCLCVGEDRSSQQSQQPPPPPPAAAFLATSAMQHLHMGNHHFRSFMAEHDARLMHEAAARAMEQVAKRVEESARSAMNQQQQQLQQHQLQQLQHHQMQQQQQQHRQTPSFKQEDVGCGQQQNGRNSLTPVMNKRFFEESVLQSRFNTNNNNNNSNNNNSNNSSSSSNITNNNLNGVVGMLPQPFLLNTPTFSGPLTSKIKITNNSRTEQENSMTVSMEINGTIYNGVLFANSPPAIHA
ncbi:hypothetical protein HELRODRAFT_174981 [Helobdella robusta]|uniref:REKLES domain-containing protein n=1 Tax=Helobdella robusta TaxID=6412 RepID=T1F8P1_HELRO|nr:hypothetical protein HELRODRAFT_174981 [Helobdella robusta]ESO01422.1 hypothetical protein HELRODRAFT_174981 [Helobdella robusta]